MRTTLLVGLVVCGCLLSCTLFDPSADDTRGELNDVTVQGKFYWGVGGPGGRQWFRGIDGEQWFAGKDLFTTPQRSIHWNGRRYVVVGENGSIWITDDEGSEPDGTFTWRNWGARHASGAGTLFASASCANAIYFVGAAGFVLKVTETNGQLSSWSKIAGLPTNVDFTDVACSPAGVVIVAGQSGTRWVSTAAGAFEARGGEGTSCAVEYSGSLFVEVSVSGRISTSSDLLSWTEVAFDAKWSGVSSCDLAFSEGTYAIVTDTGLVMTSGDGTNWTNFEAGTKDKPLSGVTFAPGGKLFAVGRDGTVLEATCANGACANPKISEAKAEIPKSSGGGGGGGGGGSTGGGCVCEGGKPCTKNADCGVDSNGIQNVCGCPG